MLWPYPFKARLAARYLPRIEAFHITSRVFQQKTMLSLLN